MQHSQQSEWVLGLLVVALVIVSLCTARGQQLRSGRKAMQARLLHRCKPGLVAAQRLAMLGLEGSEIGSFQLNFRLSEQPVIDYAIVNALGQHLHQTFVPAMVSAGSVQQLMLDLSKMGEEERNSYLIVSCSRRQVLDAAPHPRSQLWGTLKLVPATQPDHMVLFETHHNPLTDIFVFYKTLELN